MAINNANSHPYQVEVVGANDNSFYANSHPYKIAIVGGHVGLEARIVDELPEEGETGYIYLVLKETTSEGDIYDEWMWVLQQDGETYDWEPIGKTNEVTIVLYDTTGTNTDGAMTQKATTEMIYGDTTNLGQIHIGQGAEPTNSNSIAIGKSATAGYALYGVGIAVGDSARAIGNRGVAIGQSARAGTGSNHNNRTAVGASAQANSDGATALGTFASATGQYTVAIGSGSGSSSAPTASGVSAIAIGQATKATDYSVAIGRNAETFNAYAIAIGGADNSQQRKTRSNAGVAIGAGALAGFNTGGSSQGSYNTAIGQDAYAPNHGAIALGSFSSATTNGEMNIGVSNSAFQSNCGYNGSAYRKISGVYDGENPHDVATVGQLPQTFTNAEFNSIFNTDLEEES